MSKDTIDKEDVEFSGDIIEEPTIQKLELQEEVCITVQGEIISTVHTNQTNPPEESEEFSSPRYEEIESNEQMDKKTPEPMILGSPVHESFTVEEIEEKIQKFKQSDKEEVNKEGIKRKGKNY